MTISQILLDATWHALEQFKDIIVAFFILTGRLIVFLFVETEEEFKESNAMMKTNWTELAAPQIAKQKSQATHVPEDLQQLKTSAAQYVATVL